MLIPEKLQKITDTNIIKTLKGMDIEAIDHIALKIVCRTILHSYETLNLLIAEINNSAEEEKTLAEHPST